MQTAAAPPDPAPATLEEALAALADSGWKITDLTANGDVPSGTISVLRSKSDIPYLAESRTLVHKIGVTSGKVEARTARAPLDPNFLVAGVEVVATHRLYNIDRARLEKLIHRIFDPARLDIEIENRIGNPIVPREWFLAPLHSIDDAVGIIREGTIAGYTYDAGAVSLAARQ